MADTKRAIGAAIDAAVERVCGRGSDDVWRLAAHRTQTGLVARREIIHAVLAAAAPDLWEAARHEIAGRGRCPWPER